MDEPTPPEPAAPETPAPEARLPTPRDERIAAQLQTLIETRDPVVAWARGWVSRESRLPELLAARTLDFAVLTDRALFLVTTGFFTRRPRRCVYSAALSAISAARDILPGGRRLRIITNEGPALRIELRATDQGRMFAAAVIARVPSEKP